VSAIQDPDGGTMRVSAVWTMVVAEMRLRRM
jgi:hypothetical protein